MYRIHILTNDEFDNLGTDATRGSYVGDSLGFANKFTGDAYVRANASADLQHYLISHELEELVMNESAHEDENGIRHKGAWDVIQWFTPAPYISAPLTGTTDFGLGQEKKSEAPPEMSSSPFSSFNISGDNATPRLSEGATGASGGSPVGQMNQGFGNWDNLRGNYEGRSENPLSQFSKSNRNYLGGF